MTDAFSFDDSEPDPYDDDSWMSEPESVCNNWRGWKKLKDNPGIKHHNSYSASSILMTHCLYETNIIKFNRGLYLINFYSFMFEQLSGISRPSLS